MDQTIVLVVGAGPAGLALAACLKKAGIGCLLIEQQEKPGACWRRHYDRLHLHSPRSISALPFLSYPPGTPRYPSRDQFVSYLDEYCRHFDLRPVCNTKVLSATREINGWWLQTSAGPFRSEYLVIATGKSQVPRAFLPEGMAGFSGTALHSMNYTSGSHFKSKKVLVVGFGNSACEIAMDLYEQGAVPVMSVRSPVNIIPRELFGIPVLYWSTALSYLPQRTADRISAPLLRLALGDYAGTGLQKAVYGPSEQVRTYKKIPAIDTGALRYIREGKIRIAGEVISIAGNSVRFADGAAGSFDAIVAATGYEISWPSLEGLMEDRLMDLKNPSGMQAFFGDAGVYSCGFATSGTGMIRAISREARQIALDIERKVKS